LWSNPGELVCSPFAGIGSEGHVALRLGRKFVGCELKQEYFKLAVKNLKDAVSQYELGFLNKPKQAG
jgi:DNA modification methylase